MIPFYTFYSMFGFQRVGDLIWQAADSRVRGFLMGATAGRTTLLGEGLQHQDGHSLIAASTIPACQAYDPAFAYEVAAIVEDGINRMYGTSPEDIFYYITLYNENHPMPPRPEGVTNADINRGLYRWRPSDGVAHAAVFFSGTANRAAIEAADILRSRFAIDVELWSATSYKTLREQALETERWNRLHPGLTPRRSVVEELLGESSAPIVAVSDFMRIVPEQIAQFVGSRKFMALGTDGMGRSDTREALRRYFETDTAHVVVAVLSSLVGSHGITAETVARCIAEFGIDPEGEHSLVRD